MQLSSDVQIPDGLLAANALLSEKPHQGVPSWNLAPHQGIDERNSTVAIGLRAGLLLNRIGSRYTGKERDTESGNDYFGARYYASSMGRFMSPDWSAKAEPVPYAKLEDPQSLNLYAYAHNNPLRNIDVDGHCDSSSNATANTKCQDPKSLNVNDAGLNHIKRAEGIPGSGGKPQSEVKLDTAGHPTVGFGHKVTAADNLKVGDKIDASRADSLFKADVNTAENVVKNAAGDLPLSQGEFNALTDLVFNVGSSALTSDKSPSLMNDMSNGDYQGMSGQLRYTKDDSGGHPPGLVTRSDDRRSIFLGNDPN